MRSRTRIAVAVVCLAGLGAAIPGVMAGARSVPGWTIPRGWPAAKAERMRAENLLRQAAASRPLLPPPVLPPSAVSRPSGTVLSGRAPYSGGRPHSGRTPARSGGPTPQREAAGGAMTDPGGQSALMPGIVPLSAGGPFSPSQFLGTDLWNGLVGGRWEVVQAGGVPAGGQPGGTNGASAGLFVYTRSPDPGSSAGPDITGIRTPSPDPGGLFTIRRVRGDVLTLALPGSRVPYHFDVVSLRFSR